ncbi:chemotaxis protein (plasmid) [Pseudoalteromonas sp. T1lg65]|uniref:chemotaxis protein n=1 Tax=Pseudoalteromonas sp. T1lg65 TaxID=2077101 RepID=UPI003F793D1C
MRQATSSIDNFVIVAKVVANLSVIVDEAKRLSLTAKNARVVSVRAGEEARGFAPITNYIDEFSTATIQISKRIEEQSNSLFKLALSVMRSQQYTAHLTRAATLHDNPFVNQRVHQAEVEFNTDMHAFTRALFALQGCFEEIEKQMRSAEYIAVRSRVEASQANEFCHSLESVSDYIAGAALKIKQVTVNNLKEINKIQRNAF